jgi:hypothetical protein
MNQTEKGEHKMAQKIRKPASQKQVDYINILAAERGLRWAKPLAANEMSMPAASYLIRELQNHFSLTMGLFPRDYIRTGVFVVVDEAKAKSFC